MRETKLILDHVYEHEATQSERVFLTQPVGGGAVVDYRWDRNVDEPRRMAAHLLAHDAPLLQRAAPAP